MTTVCSPNHASRTAWPALGLASVSPLATEEAPNSLSNSLRQVPDAARLPTCPPPAADGVFTSDSALAETLLHSFGLTALDGEIAFGFCLADGSTDHLAVHRFVQAEDWLLALGLRLMILNPGDLGEVAEALEALAMAPDGGELPRPDQASTKEAAEGAMRSFGMDGVGSFRLAMLLRSKTGLLRPLTAQARYEADAHAIWVGSCLMHCQHGQLLELSRFLRELVRVTAQEPA